MSIEREFLRFIVGYQAHWSTEPTSRQLFWTSRRRTFCCHCHQYEVLNQKTLAPHDFSSLCSSPVGVVKHCLMCESWGKLGGRACNGDKWILQQYSFSHPTSNGLFGTYHLVIQVNWLSWSNSLNGFRKICCSVTRPCEWVTNGFILYFLFHTGSDWKVRSKK